ncbi:hypothetical protein PR001_g29266 [Phytophthora rubi]|uniref:RNase H type-1 domain-containing protein n=2 Tax=Phytophthora rubi TaxID=129364 RepID=A0A6A3H3I0_9STRA|nr:hypothetical protein PR001_g29266 [Phytophthora rubi]
MVSLNLARRLKLKLQMLPEPIKVSGLGGVPTYITASAKVKITLGVRVVYVMNVWVTNIGEDVEVLLGMNFMYAAGVRLSVREGLIQLPDEETILMCGVMPRQHLGLDLPVLSKKSLYLRPGEHAVVHIEYGQSNPQREVVWAGRGDRWVTQIIYAARSWATAVKVVNISEQIVWIDTRTPLARIVEFGSFPHSGRFVRPGCRKYKEWQQLIYESTPSPEMRWRERELEELEREQEPPSVMTPQYEWPSKITLRPRPGTTAARIVQLQARPKQARSMDAERSTKDVCSVATQTTELVDVGVQTDVVQEAKGRVKAPPVISMEMLEADFAGYVLSFDGTAKTSTRQGSCGCIIWELPGWNILTAHGFILEDVTVNDAEYYGLLKGLGLAAERNIQDLVVVGDSRIVIQQVQGLINCNQPNLQRRLSEVEMLKEKFKSMRLVHVKREYNQAADYLTSKTLALGASWQTEDPEELKHLVQASKIHEKPMKPLVILDEIAQGDSSQRDLPVETPNDIRQGPESAPLSTAARIMVAVTRSHAQEPPERGEPMGPLEYQAERWRRIKAHQECDDQLMEIKKFLKGDLDSFSRGQIRRLSKQAELYALDVRDVLYRLSRATKDRP